MIRVQRRSPVSFAARPVKTENRNHWTVVLEYEEEGSGPWLIDLSHQSRWDLQNRRISNLTPLGVKVPGAVGSCHLEKGILINRLNRNRASIWQLSADVLLGPSGSAYTDITESTVCLALAGKRVFAIVEKLSDLDLIDPKKEPPFVLQGPFCHVPCQVVGLSREGFDGTVLVTCSRGYGHDMVHTILDAGKEFRLRPAGENSFNKVEE